MSDRLADKLREAIRKSGQSAYAIGKETGVDETTISRFLAGADMRLSRAEKIAAHLGLELRKKR